MVKLPRVTAAELLPALWKAGGRPLRQRGGHLHLAHNSRPGRVTVPVHAGEIVKPGILSSILEQAGLSPEELRRLL